MDNLKEQSRWLPDHINQLYIERGPNSKFITHCLLSASYTPLGCLLYCPAKNVLNTGNWFNVVTRLRSDIHIKCITWMSKETHKRALTDSFTISSLLPMAVIYVTFSSRWCCHSEQSLRTNRYDEPALKVPTSLCKYIILFNYKVHHNNVYRIISVLFTTYVLLFGSHLKSLKNILSASSATFNTNLNLRITIYPHCYNSISGD